MFLCGEEGMKCQSSLRFVKEMKLMLTILPYCHVNSKKYDSFSNALYTTALPHVFRSVKVIRGNEHEPGPPWQWGPVCEEALATEAIPSEKNVRYNRLWTPWALCSVVVLSPSGSHVPPSFSCLFSSVSTVPRQPLLLLFQSLPPCQLGCFLILPLRSTLCGATFFGNHLQVVKCVRRRPKSLTIVMNPT